MLLEKGVKQLTLTWLSRPVDESFTLQMNDESNYFRNKYTGPLVSYTVTDLYRNTEYKFRVRTCSSLHSIALALVSSSWRHTIKKGRVITRKWPRIERCQTGQIHQPSLESREPSRPRNAGLPGVSSRAKQLPAKRCICLILDPPRDNGGADIQQYHLELDESKGEKRMAKE